MIVNLNGLLEKPDSTYPSRNSQSGISGAKLRNYSEDPGPILKILYFSGDHQFFQKSVR